MRRHFGGRKVPPHSRFVVLFGARGRSFPESLCQKERFLAEVVLAPLRVASGIFKDQGAAIGMRDFLGLPIWALVEALGLCAGGIPFLVEPVQVRFVIGYPFLDGLPGWLDRLYGLIRPPRPAGFGFVSVQNASVPRRFSISKGGGGERGRWMRPSQRPWRRMRNLISSRRMKVRTGFMLRLQQGHWSRSPAQTLRVRSRKRGCMSRTLRLGGAGIRWIWVDVGGFEGSLVFT